MAKTYYENRITTDNGEVLLITGWFYKDFPSVGEQHIQDITNCFADMA